MKERLCGQLVDYFSPTGLTVLTNKFSSHSLFLIFLVFITYLSCLLDHLILQSPWFVYDQSFICRPWKLPLPEFFTCGVSRKVR